MSGFGWSKRTIVPLAFVIQLLVASGFPLLVLYLTKHLSFSEICNQSALPESQNGIQDLPEIHTVLLACPEDLNRTNNCELVPHWSVDDGLPKPYALPASLRGGQAHWYVNHSVISEIVNAAAIQTLPQEVFYTQLAGNGSTGKIEPFTWFAGKTPPAGPEGQIGPFQEIVARKQVRRRGVKGRNA